jgi:AcrR family transcriptional regulator
MIVTWVGIWMINGTLFHSTWNVVPLLSRCKDARVVRKAGRVDRRTDALSRARIVQAAIELLDADGEAGLTFRALAARLATGAGAIYWHVANKGELLAAATDDIVAAIMVTIGDADAPADAIRALALGLFDAIDAHPWVGAQLSTAPLEAASLQVFERIGVQLQALGVADHTLFAVASTLVSYVLGVAGQNAANARLANNRDREGFLATVAARWAALDAEAYPFTRRMAAQLRDHDDREQFLTGIDLILAGIAARS